MSNILATWICIDDISRASWFPSTKGSSADKRVQDIYWRCLAVNMFTARFFNPFIKLAVFANIKDLPVVDGVNFTSVFEQLNIQFYTTPFDYQTPEGYYRGWRNQFYEFSILEYIISNPDIFNKEDNFCLIDSDCLVTGDLGEMYSFIQEYKLIGYALDYSQDHIINGISRVDMKTIFERILNRPIQKVPIYYAGEFLGLKVSLITVMMKEFYVLWDKSLYFHANNLSRLNEEAHILSFLFYKTGYENNYANKFIKRMWTTTYRNILNSDINYLIWHLPAEKIYGFKKMYSWLLIQKGDKSHDAVMKKIRSFFTVPHLPVKLRIFYGLKRVGKAIFKKVRLY